MADVYRPHACTEREALERLASEAELGHDRLSRARIDFDSSIHRRITLWVPDLVGQSQPPESAVGLDEGLARLLVNATTGTADPRRAAAPSDERLFITSRVSADAIVATLRRLERFATPARVARLQSAAGAECVAAPRARRSRAPLGLLRAGGARALRGVAVVERL